MVLQSLMFRLFVKQCYYINNDNIGDIKMKKIFSFIFVGFLMICSVFAVPIWSAKDIDFDRYKVVSTQNMNENQADQLLYLIGVDTPFFKELLENGYFNVKFTDGKDGVWFMFLSGLDIVSFQAVKCNKNNISYIVKKWEVNN